MPHEISGRCVAHPSDLAHDLCAVCGEEFCEGCLVGTVNARRSLCVRCALAAAGVRSSARRRVRPVSSRELKRRRQASEEIRERILATYAEQDQGHWTPVQHCQRSMTEPRPAECAGERPPVLPDEPAVTTPYPVDDPWSAADPVGFTAVAVAAPARAATTETIDPAPHAGGHLPPPPPPPPPAAAEFEAAAPLPSFFRPPVDLRATHVAQQATIELGDDDLERRAVGSFDAEEPVPGDRDADDDDETVRIPPIPVPLRPPRLHMRTGLDRLTSRNGAPTPHVGSQPRRNGAEAWIAYFADDHR